MICEACHLYAFISVYIHRGPIKTRYATIFNSLGIDLRIMYLDDFVNKKYFDFTQPLTKFAKKKVTYACNYLTVFVLQYTTTQPMISYDHVYVYWEELGVIFFN